MNTTELKKIIKKELNSLEPCEEGLEEFETKDLKDISNGSKVWFASRNVRTCKIALESGLFDVNMKDNDGNTALMYAVGREDYNTVKLLLDNGADVNMKNNDGDTALDYAKEYERTEIIELLNKYTNK